MSPLHREAVPAVPSPPPPASAGLERDKFDNKTVSFEEHIKFEHNMWNYLYFIVLVRVKNKTDYTGPESYVAQMIKVWARGGGWSGQLWTLVNRQQGTRNSWSRPRLLRSPASCCAAGVPPEKSPQRTRMASGARGCLRRGGPACGGCSVALSEGPFLAGREGGQLSEAWVVAGQEGVWMNYKLSNLGEINHHSNAGAKGVKAVIKVWAHLG